MPPTLPQVEVRLIRLETAAAAALTSEIQVPASVMARIYRLETIGQRPLGMFEPDARGDAATDDRAVIQAAIDALAESGGGIVWLRQGDYLIGSPGLVIPESNQVPIGIWGMGSGTSGVATRLTRDGAYPLLTAAGTGTTGTAISHDLHLRDLTFNGDSQNATLVRLDRCAGVNFENVRIQYSGRAGLHASQLWNSRFTSCIFETSGDEATTTPSVLLDGYAYPGTTHTVHFASCHWEGNNWNDLELGGYSASDRLSGVFVMNAKIEANAAGSCIAFDQAQYCQIVGGMFLSNAGSGEPVILHTAGLMNNLSNLTLVSEDATYLVQAVAGGQLTVTGCGMMGGTSAHVRLDSGFGQATVVGNAHFTLTSEANISDARSSPTGILMDETADKILFGAGSNLYESAAATLKTDGKFVAGNDLSSATDVIARQGGETVTLAENSGKACVFFGSAADTNLYRSATDTLKTDDALHVTADVVARLGDTRQVIVGDDNAGNAGLRLGSTGDTNLFRAAADTLKTSDGLWAVGGLVTATKAGVPSDSDLVAGMQQSGAMILDTTNSRIYFRVGSTWKYAALT